MACMEQAPIAAAARETEWRCDHCGKLLGHLTDGRLRLRLGRGHEYLVGFPATTVCRGCRGLNEVVAASSVTTPLTRARARRATPVPER
ncbi:MAG: hypothetical protein ABIY55_05365 [Kofleriaceae bacterium]